MTINAIIADDHELVREALQVRLQRMDVQIVAEAINGQQVVDLAASVDFDLILMDISMPVINGVEATHQIKQANPTCKILVLSTHDSQDYIRAVAAAGADGYLLKSADFDEMQRAVQVVAMGGSYFAETIKEKAVRRPDFR